MKTMKVSYFRIALVAMLFLAVTVVPAAADLGASASREMPASVTRGDQFQVTVNVANYGSAGQVLEKIPSGFTYLGSSLQDEAVSLNGSKVSFLLMGETSFSYTLEAPSSSGTYTFEGLLRDINKNVVYLANSSISVKSSSGGSSGGSSSGGGGSSPEPQGNVEIKELSNQFVSNGNRIRFAFPQEVTCLIYIDFDAKRTLGKTTTIVEMLKGKSNLVSEMPSGEIYRYLNIWVGSGGVAGPENIENGVIGFKVEKAWMEEKGIDAASINLLHYTEDAWEKLETLKVSEDDEYVYFEAKTSVFSPFAISAETAEETSNVEILPEESESAGSEDGPASAVEDAPESEALDDEPSGLPGFGSMLAAGIICTAYCILRRKE